ncbi:phenylalanine--tRNA ligase subunit beta [Bacillus sp. FSL W7-1360]
MLVSYKWLQEYVDVSDQTPQDIAEKMTRGGIEIDFVHVRNSGVSDVVVGYVKEIAPHPDADKLRVCQVDIGAEETVQIVCGAANVDAGQFVAVAKVGARLPGGMKIKKAKLRGQVSHGMICSLPELGIDSALIPKHAAEGIYVFAPDAGVVVGQDVRALFALNDDVLELDLTPNRSDCMHMLGVAYEVAALYDRTVHVPEVSTLERTETTSISVRVENRDDTPYYQATAIAGVTVAPSPLWLQNRLMAAGIRPINNVVDVTNYVLLEYGQPLHAFDHEAFGSKEVLVRRAQEGERFTTLDGVERLLTGEQLVVTNGTTPVALAGVMGGRDTEVNEKTTTILLEAAAFHPTVVRHSARTASLRTDSSARFEKGINEARVVEAAQRAAALIQELAGGTILACAAADHRQLAQVVVSLNIDAMNKRLGTSLSFADVGDMMRRLQFSYEECGENLKVMIPARRADIRIPEDLYEEIARIYGYDRLPVTLPEGVMAQGKRTIYQEKRQRAKRFLEGAGLSEVISYSLTSKENAVRYMEEDCKPIQLSMPMSEARSTMRTSLLPHLYDICTHNLNHKNNDLFIYETGSVFLTTEATLTASPKATERLAALVTGRYLTHPWQGEEKQVDFFLLKGILEGLFAALRVEKEITFTACTRDGFHPGRTARIALHGTEIGFLAQVHPSVAEQLDLKETYVCELDLETLLTCEQTQNVFAGVPRYPAVTRDIALVVDTTVATGTLQSLIYSAGGALLTNAALFDVYEGEHMDEGKKSVAFALTYRHAERTLTDEEVTNVHEQVLAVLEKEAGATLRAM